LLNKYGKTIRRFEEVSRSMIFYTFDNMIDRRELKSQHGIWSLGGAQDGVCG
jgi:hypothetical protein